MRMSITSVFGVPLENLHEKYGFPTPGFFSGVSKSGVSRARRVWQGVHGAELGKLEWSSPKHAITSRW